MNQDELVRTIQSVGMTTFVKYFTAFLDYSISSEDLVEGLTKIEKYGNNSAKTKVNAARRIIKNNLAVEALKVISKSNNVEGWVVQKATYLLEKK
ncbi:hypothetical protein [Photobacterium alginatilyticum]|uniref:Uncharacterized protein n=1 Tax=Photobacterium alginatilyticum TaxID=1775171 RepID=A0ABW9YQH2_9GAMM|nr:hypothetical protein [Photobacterium alginatilyticum]NBI56198.1 hypothetical protein [Photobacterium alginatilyticum]